MNRKQRVDEVLQSAVGPLPSSPTSDGKSQAAKIDQMPPSNPKLSGDDQGILRTLSKDEREQKGAGRHERTDKIRGVIQLTALTLSPPDASKV